MNILKEDNRLREIIIPFQNVGIKCLLNSTSIYISLIELSKIIDLEPKTIKFDITNDIEIYNPYLNIKNNIDLKLTNNTDEVIFLLNDKTINLKEEDIFLDEDGINDFLIRSEHTNGKLFAGEISLILYNIRTQNIQITRDGHLGFVPENSDRPDGIKDLMYQLGDVLSNHIDRSIGDKIETVVLKIKKLESQNENLEENLNKFNKIINNHLIDREQKDMLHSKGQAIAKEISRILDIPFKKVAQELWTEFKRNFKLKKYSHLPRKYYEAALNWLKHYKYNTISHSKIGTNNPSYVVTRIEDYDI